MAGNADADGELGKGLKQRHLTMIAIGGVIGAGLFVGSGVVISEVGPGAFLTYALNGVLIVMVMRMLGEMAVANLYSVRSYGEFEYWFAGIKVATIIAFLALGALFVLGLWPDQQMDFSNITDDGLLPNGFGTLFSGIIIVIFSMVGAEIATMAAAESDEPERAIVRATNSVVFRIMIFFVGSIFLLAAILPWESLAAGDSPYVEAMEVLGIPAAAEIMNLVVLPAVLSCLNSGLYTASRMLFVLSARNEAPERMLSLNSKGVPVWAILFSTLIGYACVVAAWVSPDRVFLFLLNSSGAIILFVYLLICLSQLRLRRMTEATAPEKLRVKMWLYPGLSLLTAAAIIAILVAMGLKEGTRSQLLLSLLAWAVVLVAYWVRRQAIGDAHNSEHGLTAEHDADKWMHEHGAAAELEVDAVVGEGPLDKDLIRRVREDGGLCCTSLRHRKAPRVREVGLCTPLKVNKGAYG